MGSDLLDGFRSQFRPSRAGSRGHAKTKHVPKQIVQKKKRSDDQRMQAPPAECQVDQSELPKMPVNARLAKIALDRTCESHDQGADVLIKGHALGGGLGTTTLADHVTSPSLN